MIRRSRGGSPNRNGPGLLRTTARTAVIAGTATAVSKGVSNAMDSSAQQRTAAQHEAMAQQADPAAFEAVPAAAPATLGPEQIALLQQLAELRSQGILTEEEFTAQKARILG